MSSVTLSNISKHFGQTPALADIDLVIKDGEFCVLLGPSGCGKSTLLSIIAGLTPQGTGSIRLDGEPIDRLSPRERDVAMVFQNYALYPHMTVARNLGFGLRMRKVSKDIIKKKVAETAQLLGIEALLERKPRELSGGQQQRVAMGRALVRRPRIFLLDEPLSNLDARLRADVRLELKRLHQKIQSTILYVTHDQVEAMTLGDKVVVMRKGRIHQVGSPLDIYSRPVDTFVAKFIGSPEMNLYRGSITRKDDTIAFGGNGFELNLKEIPLDFANEGIELGLRPEDICIGDGEKIAFRAKVEMLSDQGSEKYIHCRIGQENLTVRASKEAVYEPGHLLLLSINPSCLHVFQNGIRIKRGESALV